MSGVPKEIPGIGAASLAVRLNPEFDPMRARGLTTESYFVLSRVDGRATLKDLILMTGFTVDKAVGILSQLRGLGALMLPDENPAKLRERAATEPATATAPEVVLDEEALSDDERAALLEDVALSDVDRRRVLAMRQRMLDGDYFALLSVPDGADRKEVKRAYFKLSKEFHPDRFYGKATGSFGAWLAEVFQALSKAYDTLSDPASREAYESARRGDSAAASPPRAQTKEEHAAQLFAQGCSQETGGDREAALRLFAAVIRLDPRAKYMRRAARCSLAAGQPAVAEEYARKAAQLEPRNPSSLRVLADALRGAHKLDEAEKTLLAALNLKSENDVLAGELQEDLARVRKLMETR